MTVTAGLDAGCSAASQGSPTGRSLARSPHRCRSGRSCTPPAGARERCPGTQRTISRRATQGRRISLGPRIAHSASRQDFRTGGACCANVSSARGCSGRVWFALDCSQLRAAAEGIRMSGFRLPGGCPGGLWSSHRSRRRIPLPSLIRSLGLRGARTGARSADLVGQCSGEGFALGTQRTSPTWSRASSCIRTSEFGILGFEVIPSPRIRNRRYNGLPNEAGLGDRVATPLLSLLGARIAGSARQKNARVTCHHPIKIRLRGDSDSQVLDV